MDSWEQLHVVGQVLVAMILGGVIGIDRELEDKPAGFRTQMLVAGSAALFVALASAMIQHFEVTASGLIRADPIRIVQSIILGISFLGAGTILRRDRLERVEGLTTAAALLISAAVGICVAVEHYVVAGGITVATLVTLRLLGKLERWVRGARRRSAPPPEKGD